VSQTQAGLKQFQRNNCIYSTQRRTPLRTVSPPQAPEATEQYLIQAKSAPVKLSKKRKLLVILDLNGTLLARPDRRYPARFVTRPGVPQFLEYIFENHVVMVYTSMQRRNAGVVVGDLFSPEQRQKLVVLWARDMLDLSPEQLHEKVQVYKKLEKVWSNPKIQESYPEGADGKWDQSNTVLVDDNHLKALAQPHNLLQVPEFLLNRPKGKTARATWVANEESSMVCLTSKLEELKYQVDVSRLIFHWQTGKAEPPQQPQDAGVVKPNVTKPKSVQPLTPESLRDAMESKICQSNEARSVNSCDGKVVPKSHHKEESPVLESVFKELLGLSETSR